MPSYASPEKIEKIWRKHLRSPAIAGRMGKQRDISDFFKPNTRVTVPAKRPSSGPSTESLPAKRLSPSPEIDRGKIKYTSLTGKARNGRVKTPVTPSRFKGPNLKQSPIPFKAQVILPVGSPRRESSQSQPVTSSALSTLEATPTKRTSSFDFPSIPSPGSKNVSFASTTSSKQVVKEGKLVAVRDSDEDDSDTSLEDPDELFGVVRGTSSISASPPEDSESDDDAEGLLKQFKSSPVQPRLYDRKPIIGKAALKATKTQVPKYKFNLDDILARHLGDRNTEEQLAKMNASNKEKSLQREMDDSKDLDKNLLAAMAFDDDEGEGQKSATRLMGAVERTEAISGDKRWSFFETNVLPSTRNPPKSFPLAALSSGSWKPTLRDASSRQRAFLSGYLADMWSTEQADARIITWLFDSMISEPRVDLRDAYVATVRQLSAESVQDGIGPDFIESIFSKLGARKEALQVETALKPAKDLDGQSSMDLHPVLAVIKSMEGVSGSLSQEASERLASILIRMMLDERLMKNPSVLIAVESAILQLIGSVPAPRAESLCDFLHDDIIKSVTDPSLQKTLLNNLPSQSQHIASLRIRLAQSFLFPDASEQSLSLSTLLTHLSSSIYSSLIHTPSSEQHSYDFATLSCYITFLSTAVSDTLDLDLRHSDPKIYNSLVDQLADRIKAIFSAITDTGASHMKRTEVKEALESLMFRLIYAVRTKPKPRNKLWIGDEAYDDDKDVAKLSGKDILKNFLDKKKQPSLPPVEGEKDQAADTSSHTSANDLEGDTIVVCSSQLEAEQNHLSPTSTSSTEDAIRQQLGLMT